MYFPKRQTAAFSDVKSIIILILDVGKFGNNELSCP